MRIKINPEKLKKAVIRSGSIDRLRKLQTKKASKALGDWLRLMRKALSSSKGSAYSPTRLGRKNVYFPNRVTGKLYDSVYNLGVRSRNTKNGFTIKIQGFGFDFPSSMRKVKGMPYGQWLSGYGSGYTKWRNSDYIEESLRYGCRELNKQLLGMKVGCDG